MSKPNTELYNERLARYVTANHNGKPDRIPIRIFAEELAAKYAGYTNYETAVNHELQFDVNRKFAEELGCDAIQTNSIVNWMVMIKALGWEGITFPGIGLPVDVCNQWTEPKCEEEAFLKADEYDRFSDDPTAFILNTWLPRFTRHINPPGCAVTFEHNTALLGGLLAYSTLFNTWGRKTAELIDAGIVPAVSSVLKAPLDLLADKLRGYLNLCGDLVEQRDKVIRACEAMMPHLLELVLSGADPDRNIPSIIWMHRGCVPYISHEDFSTIYWATLKPIVEELWANGQQIIFYAEGNWNAHLKAFAELPEKSIIFHVDKTDFMAAHRALGGKFCLSGGIPNDLLAIGGTKDVRAYCKKVIDSVARDGGYIMDAAALIMNDAKIDNVRAMIDYAKEHGAYSRSAAPAKTLQEIKACDRPGKGAYRFLEPKRKPGVCVPWEEKRKDLPPISGDEQLARQNWEMVDRQAWTFCWVNLTW